MKDSVSAFGAAVRRLRVAQRLSQEKLAHAADLDRTYISSLERGRRNPSLATIIRVARALGVEAHVILAMMNEGARERARER